jgi:hypothetical protein
VLVLPRWDDCVTQMGGLQQRRVKRALIGLAVFMSVAAVAAVVRLSRARSSAPPVSEAQARAEANEVVKHLGKLDGYPFDARFSEGARDQAVRLADLTRDAYDYFAVTFPGTRPQLIATYLKPVDWPRNYGVPSYYPPDRRLRVATDDSPLWQSFGRIVHVASPFAAYPRLRSTYGDAEGNLHLRRFFDLFAVHELAHAFELQGGAVLPTLWLKELFADLALYTFVAINRPSELANLMTFPDALMRVGAFNVMIRLRGYTSLDDFDRHSPAGNARAPISNQNAVWYQIRLLLLARDVFNHDREHALQRLWTFGLKQAGRVERPEDYFTAHGTLDGWSAAIHAQEIASELSTEVSPTLARAVAEWPRNHGASDPQVFQEQRR